METLIELLNPYGPILAIGVGIGIYIIKIEQRLTQIETTLKFLVENTKTLNKKINNDEQTDYIRI